MVKAVRSTPAVPPQAPRRVREDTVATASPTGPLYKQVVAVLRDEILKGVHPIGGLLPTENELCERFDMSRHTVREALRELRANGLVASRRGSGTTVIQPATASHSYVHQVGSIADLSQYAIARWEILSSEMVAIDEVLAERLQTPPGTRWLKMEACRYLADPELPVAWTQFYLHPDYAQVSRLIGKQVRPIYELIHDLYGEQVNDVTQTMHGEEVAEPIAKLLKIKKGSMVIEVERTYRLASGKVIEASNNVYPASTFRFSIKLQRLPNAG